MKLSMSQFDRVSPQKTAKLQGTVVDSVTGKPVANAEVRVVIGLMAFPEDNFVANLPNPSAKVAAKPAYSATTDSSGRFIIQGIRPGAYCIGVAAEGYVHYEMRPPSSSISTVMNITPDTEDLLTVRLLRGATISGRLTTTERQPLKDVIVYLLRQTFDVNGNRRLTAQKMVTTSGSGDYVFTDVKSGPYFVVAGRGASFIAANASQPLYGWTFYPGQSDPLLAARIDASAGAFLGGLNFTVTPRQPRRLTGTVIDSRTGKPPGTANIFVWIYSPFEVVGADIGGVRPYDPSTGRFEATGLIDGVYAIGVDLGGSSPKDREFVLQPRDAWKQIEMSGSDTDGIEIRVPRTGYVRGRLTLEGGGALSTLYPAQESVGLAPSGPQVTLIPTKTVQPIASTRSVDAASGVFEFPGVLSGKFRLQVQGLPPGYYAKVIRLNGALASDLLFDLQSDAGAQLDITIAPGAGELKGLVLNERESPVAGAPGLLLPDPLPQEIAYFRTFIAEATGNFTLSGIRPGKYRIYAFDGLDFSEFPEPDLLRRSASQGAQVDVKEGSRLSVSVRLASRKG